MGFLIHSRSLDGLSQQLNPFRSLQAAGHRSPDNGVAYEQAAAEQILNAARRRLCRSERS